MAPVVVIVQARVSSKRLPAKALLPIAGIPAVALVARRAANRGLPVRVATSTEACDDVLVEILKREGISTRRGPLEDALHRFCLATEDLAPDGFVVRLTADNVFPDGAFIEHLVRCAASKGVPYLGTDGSRVGLPYGMSAEVFTTAALREAERRASSAPDREHVTAWIRRQYGDPAFQVPHPSPNLHQLRCTIDNLDDYCRIASVFENIEDPVQAPWPTLCERLAAVTPEPQLPPCIRGCWVEGALTLGTAQLGLEDYGRARQQRARVDTPPVEIVRYAVRHGVKAFDTARSYGRAEAVLGEARNAFGQEFHVVTKLAPLDDLSDDASETEARWAVDASIFRSLSELRTPSLRTVLLHRWRHRRSHREAIWKRLNELADQGLIGALGASVYTPEEALEALKDPKIRHLQLPFNLLDKRWETSGVDQAARERSDVVVHARSVLLQGLLVSPYRFWPRLPGVDARALTERMDQIARKLDRHRLELCIDFLRAQPWIHSLVLGVDHPAQLDEILAVFHRPPLTADQVALVRSELPEVPDQLLNPSVWPRANG